MAWSQCYLVLSALSLFSLMQIATPLRCYVCTTVVDGKSCEDPFNKTAVTADTCDDPISVCAKEILPALGKFPESTHRTCASENYCKQHEKGSKHCSLCSVDECNSSLIMSPSFSIIFVTSAYYIYNNLLR